MSKYTYEVSIYEIEFKDNKQNNTLLCNTKWESDSVDEGAYLLYIFANLEQYPEYTMSKGIIDENTREIDLVKVIDEHKSKFWSIRVTTND